MVRWGQGVSQFEGLGKSGSSESGLKYLFLKEFFELSKGCGRFSDRLKDGKYIG